MFLGMNKHKFTIGQRVRIKGGKMCHFFPVGTIVEVIRLHPTHLFKEFMYECINPLDNHTQTVKESEIEAVTTDTDDAWDRAMGIL